MHPGVEVAGKPDLTRRALLLAAGAGALATAASAALPARRRARAAAREAAAEAAPQGRHPTRPGPGPLAGPATAAAAPPPAEPPPLAGAQLRGRVPPPGLASAAPAPRDGLRDVAGAPVYRERRIALASDWVRTDRRAPPPAFLRRQPQPFSPPTPETEAVAPPLDRPSRRLAPRLPGGSAGDATASGGEAGGSPAPAVAAPPGVSSLPAGPDRQPLVSLSPEVRHVIARLTYGPTPALVAEVEAIGPAAFVQQQLDPARLDDAALEGVLARSPVLGRSAAELRDGNWSLIKRELRHAVLLRALWSRRQLHQRMVDFWSDHFNVWIGKGLTLPYLVPYVRDVIRPHAMGRFVDLLRATAQSPAMLHYLDNARSRGDNPNENYGRELLELHSVGVDAGYTNEDVRNASLLLSGWTIGEDHRFRFRPEWHHEGPLRVMDFASAGTGGQADGLALLDHLARHPATARFLAYKLCRRFVQDDPPEALVESAADIYLANDTAIVPVLRHLLGSATFWESAGKKLRRPFDYLVAVLRVLGASPETAGGSDAARWLQDWMARLGQPLFEWLDPDGYPDRAAAWLGSEALRQRWGFAGTLAHGWTRGVAVDLSGLLPDPLPATAGELVGAAGARLHAGPLPRWLWSALLDFLGVPADAPLTPRLLESHGPALAALLLASPDWQRC